MERYDLDELLRRENDLSRWMASVSSQGADVELGEPASTLLNTVLGHLSTRVFVFDCDMTLVWVNDFGARQLGFTPEKMIGKNWYRLMPRMEARRPIYEKVMQGEVRDCFSAVDFPDGTRYFSPHYSPIWDADGAVIGMVAAVNDVTERRQAEQEKLVVDEIARIISSTLDLEEVYERFAQEVRKVVDCDRMDISLIDRAEGAYIVKYVFGLAQAGRRPGDIISLEGSLTEQVITSGCPVITREATAPVYPADSSLAGIGLRSGIILPLKHLGQNLGAMSLHSARPSAFGAREQAILERLASQISPAVASAGKCEQSLVEQEREELARQNSRLASIGQMASGVAHEINNPLGIIQGFAEQALLEGLPPRVNEDIQAIIDQTQRAARIVKNVLSLASPQIRKKELVGVGDFITRATEMKANELQLCNIDLTTWFSSEMPSVFGDFYQLVEVMLNVITNAQQAMRDARGGGELKISAQTLDDRVVISVSDNGPGISPEHLTRIFDPFFTTKKIGKGTGLGLSISQGIIADHGGEMWAESPEGTGATFYVALPASSLPAGSLPASSGLEGAVTSVPVAAGAPGPAKRVLVVDDNPGYRALLGKALTSRERRVDQARNGQEAWDMAQAQTYDCIIIDLLMPVLTGQQLYQRIKESNRELAERCIFITGATYGRDVEEFLASVGNPSLRKPFSLDEISRHVSGMGDSGKIPP